jgi:fused signal recognition particle receptor
LSWTQKLKQSLTKTRNQLGQQFSSLLSNRTLDQDTYEELEAALLSADAGVEATEYLLEDLRIQIKRTDKDVQTILKESLSSLLKPLEKPLDTSTHRPFIIMLTGVNGAGKTTSIGKLAKYFQSQGLSVLLAAGDTFRAAAKEQLMAWGEKNNVTVIAQESGDPSAVIFDAINAAKSRSIDIVLADTAGRLPSQLHLMEEIKKIKRVITKAEPSAPHETLLVLDGNTGQNALAQVKAFNDALSLTGLIMTKLDGTAKGGVIAAIAKNYAIPLRFIGIGEGIDDLRPFKADEFAGALFE